MSLGLDIAMKSLENKENIKTKFMKAALKEAVKASLVNEIPVGCVIVKDGHIVARAHNKKEIKQDVVAHAEVIAIQKAEKKLNTWHLEDCDIYVTLEPCPMCSYAIILARIKNLYYGALDPKAGAHVSKINLFDTKFNHIVHVEGNILEYESTKLLKEFFKKLR